MKRLLLLAATSLALFAAAPSSALAANSTCTTHTLAAISWSTQTDTFNHSGDFQCGGANNEDYYVVIALQYKTSSGGWNNYSCPNGYLAACVAFKPATGWYQGGSEQQWTGQWNPDSPQLDCHTVRIHGTVHFRNGSPNINYNSLTYGIGGC
jgi:hypothetical protein